MIASKNRPRPKGSPGSSKVLTYVLVAVVAVLVTYYLVVPAFTPKSPVGQTGTVGTSPATVSLNPSTDISGTSVTVTGQKLPANQSVTAMFGTTDLNLTGTCKTDSTGSLVGCTFWVPKASSGSYTVSVSAGTTTSTAKFTIPQYTPPVSTILVTLTSVALGFVTQIVTRKVVDLNAERRMKAEVNAFNKEKREATAADDKAKLDKLKKRELQVRQAQAKLSTARFKVTAITFIPLLGVYYLMATFLGGYGVIVAFTPIPIPYFAGASQSGSIFQVSLFWWYFLSSFTFSTMLTKVLHTTT